MNQPRRPFRFVRVMAMLAVFGVLAAACGDDDSGGGGASTTAAPSGDSTASSTDATSAGSTSGSTAAANAATGTPIKLGFINQEGSPAGSFPEVSAAVKAAVEYVNQQDGGAGGHPLEIETCITDGSPEKSQSCAQEMVEKKVLAVLLGANTEAGKIYPVTEAAGIPTVGGAPLVLGDAGAKNSFFFIGGSFVAFPALSKFAVQQNLKKVGVIHRNDPIGEIGANLLAKGPLEKQSASAVLVPAAPDAPDYTDAVNQAVSGGVDSIMIIQAADACKGIIEATRTANPDLPILAPGSCRDESLLQSLGDKAKGIFFTAEFSNFLEPDKNPDVKIFVDAMKKYGGDNAILAGFAQMGFSEVLNVRDAIVGAGADTVTSASLATWLGATKAQKSFMGNPYTCADQVLKLGAAVCQDKVLIYQYDGKNLVVQGDWISGYDLL